MPRDYWQFVWRLATSKAALIALLAAVAVSLVAAAWLPQLPSSSGVLYAQRVSEANLRFGAAADTLRRLGLFNITRSLGFRVLLTLLGVWLLLSAVDGVESLWAQFRSHDDGDSAGISARVQCLRVADLSAVCVAVGGLVILGGLLLNTIWGWREDGITLQGSDLVPISQGTGWVAWEPATERISSTSGIRTMIEAIGPGFTVRALDGAGQSLYLQQSPTSPRVKQLALALTEDQYFAVPDVGLVVRLSANLASSAVHDGVPVLVQVFSSPSGQLVVESNLTGDAILMGMDVTLQFTSVPFAQVSAQFLPGRWPIFVGGALVVIGSFGLAGSAARSQARSRSRSPAGHGQSYLDDGPEP